MRRDAIIDKRKVRCPNASLIGYGKLFAQVGDVVRFTEGDTPRIGRMIGRVAYAPSLQGEGVIKDYILCAVLGHDLTCMTERWVNPANVSYVTPVGNQGEVCAAFFSDTLTKTPLDIVRMAAHDLWTTVAAYLTWRKEAGL